MRPSATIRPRSRFVIPTGSMENTLKIGDHLIVDYAAYFRTVCCR